MKLVNESLGEFLNINEKKKEPEEEYIQYMVEQRKKSFEE